MRREATYKPLLFSTTMRNPERIKMFLEVLKRYDKEVLTDNLAERVAGELIRHGVYRPMKRSTTVKRKMKANKPLTNREVEKVLKDNPQSHKEAGFSKGWPSRFDTWFKISKELGFVFYRPGEKIRFSEVGLKLINSTHPEFLQQIFLNSLSKYQRNNPFRRIRNENSPMILLLQVINKLNNDKEFNGSGISRSELPLLIYWKDSNSEKLYQRIKRLRKKFGYSPSVEVVIEICRSEIMRGADTARNVRSVVMDYPDDFIRKMRLTGLISLRGGGRFIDINKNEQSRVDYVLRNYSEYRKYNSEESYFKYISAIDENLISLAPDSVSVSEQDKFLEKWVEQYVWGTIKKEMKILPKRQLSKDRILKYLSHPIRLEFLTALAVKSKFPSVKVIPNYPVDDEGIPTSTAAGSGDTGDIECFEGVNGILIEVTMSEGVAQTKAEVWPIARHLEKFSEGVENSMCYFIAPSIFKDSERQIGYVKAEDGLLIIPKTIEEFLEYLESGSALYSNA